MPCVFFRQGDWRPSWSKGSRWEVTPTRKGVNLWRRLLLRWPHVPRPRLFAIGFLFAAVQDMQFSAMRSNSRMNSFSGGCSDRPSLPRIQKEVIPLGSFEAFMDKTFDTEVRPPFKTPRLSGCGGWCACWCFAMFFHYPMVSKHHVSQHLVQRRWHAVPASFSLLGLLDHACSSCFLLHRCCEVGEFPIYWGTVLFSWCQKRCPKIAQAKLEEFARFIDELFPPESSCLAQLCSYPFCFESQYCVAGTSKNKS